MSAESRSEATWRGFFMAAISAGVGTVVGTIGGFFVGGLADAVILAATGHGQVRYAYLLAEAGTYIGLFVGIVVGLGTGATNAAAKSRPAESEQRRPALHHNGVRVRRFGRVKHTKHDDDSDDLGDAAAA